MRLDLMIVNLTVVDPGRVELEVRLLDLGQVHNNFVAVLELGCGEYIVEFGLLGITLESESSFKER